MAESDVDLIRRALDASDAFFRARDEMNSVIHLAEVRWSPITELVGKARAAVYAGLAEMAKRDQTDWQAFAKDYISDDPEDLKRHLPDYLQGDDQ